MEEVIDFDEWLKNYTPPEIGYWAIFNPDNGEVIGIYPDSAAKDKTNKLQIDKELAEDIMNGVIRMNTCYVDLDSDKIEIIEKYGLRKIDDIMHRIPNARFHKIENPDLLIEYESKTRKLTFSMSESIKNKKVYWIDETSVSFLITAYNNPYHVYQTVVCSLDDLKTSPMSFIINTDNQRFSIFTRRLFKKYLYRDL